MKSLELALLWKLLISSTILRFKEGITDLFPAGELLVIEIVPFSNLDEIIFLLF